MANGSGAPHRAPLGSFAGDGPFDITDFDITESDSTNLI